MIHDGPWTTGVRWAVDNEARCGGDDGTGQGMDDGERRDMDVGAERGEARRVGAGWRKTMG